MPATNRDLLRHGWYDDVFVVKSDFWCHKNYKVDEEHDTRTEFKACLGLIQKAICYCLALYVANFINVTCTRKRQEY